MLGGLNRLQASERAVPVKKLLIKKVSVKTYLFLFQSVVARLYFFLLFFFLTSEPALPPLAPASFLLSLFFGSSGSQEFSQLMRTHLSRLSTQKTAHCASKKSAINSWPSSGHPKWHFFSSLPQPSKDSTAPCFIKIGSDFKETS